MGRYVYIINNLVKLQKLVNIAPYVLMPIQNKQL